MKGKVNFSKEEVKHIAQLAKLSLTEKQVDNYSKTLSSILEYVSKVQSLDTEGVPETSQVTGQENVFREDVVETGRMLTQEEALSNAQKTYDGYFEVEAILED